MNKTYTEKYGLKPFEAIKTLKSIEKRSTELIREIM